MPEDIHHIILEYCHEKSLSAIEATCHAVFAQKNNAINWVLSLTINSETVNYNPFQENKLDFKLLPLTLPLPRGGGGGKSSQPPKGFSSITFEQNNLETSNFA